MLSLRVMRVSIQTFLPVCISPYQMESYHTGGKISEYFKKKNQLVMALLILLDSEEISSDRLTVF